MKKRVRLKVKTYSIVSSAVERGLQLGYQRAHKHTDHPDQSSLLYHIQDEIMNALCEDVDFDD